ncbi:hypothetical protein [Effusibacillus lacus]|uniref:hypothetical protein n=1 Tax=Effusibacillus lacus TaxID=1348429 RepID=UPI0010D871D5|nr:hypothetical protein [Effusibacillus lacus]TCS76925.1 hypothetical protein EDD64_101149 [Effusibacillus lacus]
MEVIKWLAVSVFGIALIAVVAIAAWPTLQTAGGNMVTEITTQVGRLTNLQ